MGEYDCMSSHHKSAGHMAKIGLVAVAHAGTGANGKREQEGNADQASESSSYTSRRSPVEDGSATKMRRPS